MRYLSVGVPKNWDALRWGSALCDGGVTEQLQAFNGLAEGFPLQFGSKTRIIGLI